MRQAATQRKAGRIWHPTRMRAIGEAFIDFRDVLEARGQEDVSLALLALNVEGSWSRPFLRCFEICSGDTVSVHGSTVKTHMNGKLGVVKEIKEGGMLVVTMKDGGAAEMFPSSNLKKEPGTRPNLCFPETMATAQAHIVPTQRVLDVYLTCTYRTRALTFESVCLCVQADSSVLLLSLRLFYLEPGARLNSSSSSSKDPTLGFALTQSVHVDLMELIAHANQEDSASSSDDEDPPSAGMQGPKHTHTHTHTHLPHYRYSMRARSFAPTSLPSLFISLSQAIICLIPLATGGKARTQDQKGCLC